MGDAKKCCPPVVREIYVCGNCGKDYFSGVEAGACCFELAKNVFAAPNWGTI